MKKITSIISILLLALFITSCAEKEKVDISQAPDTVVNAIEKSYQLSKELTDLQVTAGQDKNLDATEIENICKLFRTLAIVNNFNLQQFGKDKYFIALTKDRKKEFNKLAEAVVFLKDCNGYDELGLAIQKVSIEVKDVIDLPVEEAVVEEQEDSLSIGIE